MTGNIITLLVGPPGSGKSSLAKSLIYDDGDHGLATVYINQDSQGRDHLKLFHEALNAGKNILIDRMNFNKCQRDRYLIPAKEKGYTTRIRVLHESYKTCLDRCLARKDHETIKDVESARAALSTFFTKYERVQDTEADAVTRIWPEGHKPLAAIIDLDGTMCNVDHRLHFVRREGKKDWKGFFDNISGDTVNAWCADIAATLSETRKIVYCSGRPDNYREQTQNWLNENGLNLGPLYMRPRNDSRQDNIVKEIILDFELLTRYTPYLMIDDRKQVVDMWRSRGYICLQCAPGDF